MSSGRLSVALLSLSVVMEGGCPTGARKTEMRSANELGFELEAKGGIGTYGEDVLGELLGGEDESVRVEGEDIRGKRRGEAQKKWLARRVVVWFR